MTDEITNIVRERTHRLGRIERRLELA